MIKELQYGALKNFKMPRGLVAFDIGANRGEWALELSKTFAKVVAFDPLVLPDRINQRNIVWKNVALSNDRKTEIFWKDLTNSEWSHLNKAIPVSGAKYMISHKWESQIIETEILDDHYRLRPDFIKIDVEGHELSVVFGGMKTIRGARAVFIEMHSKQAFKEIDKLIGPMFGKYTLYRYAKPEVEDEWKNFFWVLYEKE